MVNSMDYNARKDFEKKRKLHKYFSGRGFVISRSGILKTEQRGGISCTIVLKTDELTLFYRY